MKNIIFLFFAPIFSYSQVLTAYHPLPVPQSGLLGKPLIQLDVKKGIIGKAPGASNKPTFESFPGPSYTSEYSRKMNDLIIPVFKKNKIRITDIKIDTLKIIALAPENFTNGNVNEGVFAYDGITADTIKITYRTAKNVEIKPAEIIDSFEKYIPNGVWKDITSIVKKVTINGKDSTETITRIVNPEVIFACRFVRYKKIPPFRGQDFENKYQIFYSREKLTLSVEGEDDNAVSDKLTPQYRGGTVDISHYYFLKAVGDAGDLHLIFALDMPNDTSYHDGYRIIREIPSKRMSNGMREYNLGYRTVDRYTDNSGFERNIRIAVYAKQTSPTTIELVNTKLDQNSKVTEPVTYMKYPYYKFEYIEKL